MATETVPADIAAAINNLIYCAQRVGATFSDFASEEQASARAALDAAILKHLRKADELKAALERITSGGV